MCSIPRAPSTFLGLLNETGFPAVVPTPSPAHNMQTMGLGLSGAGKTDSPIAAGSFCLGILQT